MFTALAQNLQVIVLSFFTSTTLTLIIERTCYRINLMDWPGERKMHKVPVPRMGGLAFFLTSFAFVIALSLKIPWPLALGSIIVFAGGFFDDLIPSNSALVKMAFQIPAAILFATFCDLHFFKLSGLELLSARIIIFGFIFFITNAVNLMDNMNGLAAGLGILITWVLSILTLKYLQDVPLALLCLLIGSSVLGFGVRNFPLGKIYMGDEGSQFLGFFSAGCAVLILIRVLSSAPQLGIILPVTLTLLLFALFITDVFSVIYIRISERRSVFVGDQCHLSHRLVKRGFTPLSAVLLLVGLQIIIVGAILGLALH